MSTRISLDRFLPQSGGWFILLVLAVAQLISRFGGVPGILSIKANARFGAQEKQVFLQTIPQLVLFSLLILFGIGWRITSTARKRLDLWSQNAIRSEQSEEFNAWQEITSLAWRYGAASLVVFTLVVILPSIAIAGSFAGAISSPFQPAALQSPDPVYVLFGGLAAVLGSVILAILAIERITLPARLALLPSDFETQLTGRSGALLGSKFIVLILGLITIAILLIAPIGYRQTIQVLYSQVSSMDVFLDIQLQSVLFSILAFLLGAGFAYTVSLSVSDPIKELISIFTKIEQGDLTQRARVSATDELGVVTVHFNRMVTRLEALQTTLELQVLERTRQLTASNEVARAASSSLNPDELIKRVVDLFPDQFGYYYAAVYLLNTSGTWAELKYATGEAGRVLKQNHHRLEVPGRSMVATALGTTSRTPS